MTWLDEIEKILQDEREFTENQIRKGYEETPEERMVRVLRKQIYYIKFLEAIILSARGTSAESLRAGANLPDDMKELLG